MGSCVRWFARSDQHLSQSLAGGSYLPGTMLGSHRAFFPPKPAVPPLVAMKTFSSSILACRGDPLCDVVIALSSGSLDKRAVRTIDSAAEIPPQVHALCIESIW